LALLLAGCSGGQPAAVEPPAFSPEDAAGQAMTQYDTNKDGFLDDEELKRCPALRGAVSKIDKNGDGKLTKEEIVQRLASIQATKAGLVGFPCQVLMNDSPFAGAKVTFVPEKFMGPNFKPASGVSDAEGNVQLTVEGLNAAGVQPGYYRIEVSKVNDAGKETLPARYNTATTLGQEVAPDPHIKGAVLRLSN
jgi:hypothetical protein